MTPRTRIVMDNYVEIERRFLVSDIDASKLPEHKKTVVEQIFLTSRDPKMDRRIRKEESDGNICYFLIEKYITSQPVIRFNRREKIDGQRFEALARRSDPRKGSIRKTRFDFVWNGQQFRVDKYDGPVAGLLILEAVLNDEKERITLPEFCRVIREITEDRDYYSPGLPAGEAGKEIRGKSPVKKRSAAFHIVAMIDLLGQGAQLEKFSRIPRTPKEKKTFDKLTQATFGTVERFRDRIRLLHGSLSSGHMVPSFVRERLTPKQLAMVSRSARAPLIGYQFFTDLAMLKINLSGQRSHRPLVSLYGLFHQLGLLILTQLAEGVLLRGAVDAGICTEFENNDLYGQAVARAYRLESQAAVYPRIAVGDGLLEYVKSFSGLKATDDERAIMNAYIDLINACVKRDDEGVSYLAYLAPVFKRSYFTGENEFWFVTKSACRFIETKLENDRLSKVADYFASEGCWTGSQGGL